MASWLVAFTLGSSLPARFALSALAPKQRKSDVSILASSLALGSADYTWRDQAMCRDTDPELFFPIGTTGQALLQIAKAKSVCCQCPVTVECLEFALETNQDTGIWGGNSEDERRQMRRTAAQQARSQRAL